MNRSARALLVAFSLSSGMQTSDAGANDVGRDRFWPEWRGPLATGEGPKANPPLEWSEDKNVRWKIELPGEGKSTPVIWGDTVYVTTAIPAVKAPPAPAAAPPAAPEAGAAPAGAPGGAARPGRPPVRTPDTPMQFTVLAYGRADGKLRWQRKLNELLPHEGTHQDGSFAGGSIITDGKSLYAYFGSRGLYALDLKGKVLWEKQLGTMNTRNGFGEGSSPALHGDTLVVTWDHEGADFIVALDAKTGKERWRAERDEPTSWATPLIVVHDKKPQVVVSATNRVKSYDLATGKVLWEATGMTANAIPSPVSSDGVVYLISGFRGSALLAVRLADAKGDITGKPAIVWSYDKDTPYVPSPLLYQDALYFLKVNSGVLTRIDTKTGKPSYTERLEKVSNVYASPVAAAGRVYVTGRDGVTAVVDAGPGLKVLATNSVADAVDASPALVDGEIYLRGLKYLYRISSN
jgi:outer membrane protein assembly factor BamB